MRYALAALTAFSICTVTLAKPLLAASHEPAPPAPAPTVSAFAVHGAVGLYWRETWAKNGDTPAFDQLQPVLAGDVYLGARNYAKGWTLGGEVEFNIRRVDDYRSLKVGLRREF